MLSDVIVAQATPPGRSAVALLRLSGRGAHDVAAHVLRPFAPLPLREARLADAVNANGERLDQVLYVCYAHPASYTGEDLVEVSTHGGLLVPAEVLSALVDGGARPAVAGEFTRRALQNGKLDLLQAEAIADLIDASAPAQRRAALRQLDRGLSLRIDELRDRVLALEALVSYDIDFPEEDSGPVPPARIAAALAGLTRALEDMLGTAGEGERLREGALAVIAGRPNAGKSSLFNALLGVERAIVTEIPGTTRDTIEAPAVCDGFPFRLADTAGLRSAEDRLEQMGIEVSRRYLAAADVILFCVEAGRGLDAGEATAMAEFEAPAVLVRTKADLGRGEDEPGLAVSTRTGDGLSALRRELARTAFSSLAGRGDPEPVVTRARHRSALAQARDEVRGFAAARADGLDGVVAATHLRAAVTALEAVIGVVAPDDVLERVFAMFCVGK